MKSLLYRPARLLILGFAATIFVGSVLLALPIANIEEQPISWIDAWFMAASAVCVTGLTVVDPGSAFNGFGQAVLLGLVQIGGLGITTLSTALILLAGQTVSFSSQDAVQGSFTLSHRISLGALLRQVLLWTFIIETLGAVFLFLTERQRLPFDQAAWFSVFHSISAFCNAGFSLRSDNLMTDHANIEIVLPMSLLIILGGLGFTVLADLAHWAACRLRRQRESLSLQAKVALAMTATLLLAGMIGFWVLERTNLLVEMNAQETLLTSWFASVTPRTAGFNTVDYGQATAATLYFTIVLMLVGGCPGSTAGGVKATTLGVLLALARSRYQGERSVRLFNRSVPEANVAKATSIMALAFVVMGIGVILLSALEVSHPLHPRTVEWSLGLLFEVASALGTTGLSTGITPQLSDGGKITIILLMFIGRLGPLTIALALARQEPRPAVFYAEEQVMIG